MPEIMDKKRFLSRFAVCLVFILTVMFSIRLFFGTEKNELVSVEGRSFEKAVVTRIIYDNLQEGGIRSGEQTIMVRMRSGKFKGEELKASSSEGNLFGAVCRPGMKVIVIVSASENGQLVSVYAKDRSSAIYSYIALFFGLLILIGGKKGLKSILGLIYTIFCIVFLYLPLIYKGVSPFFAAILIAAVTTVMTMYLIGGAGKKTSAAILSTVAGVLASGLSAWLFGKASDIDGYNVSNIETLLYLGQNTDIRIGELLFSAILIASLGAVMDVAMSIASTTEELRRKNPLLNGSELFLSALKVGRDMMGTMSNTLILAFVGGSLSVLVIDYAYDLPYLQLLNSYEIGIEVMQGISGSIGVILTVPFAAAISAAFLKKEDFCNS